MVHVRIVSEPWFGLSFLGQIFNQLPNVTQVDTIVAGLVAKDLRRKATEAYHCRAVQYILEDKHTRIHHDRRSGGKSPRFCMDFPCTESKEEITKHN